jgi:hypothetical protein
MNDDGAPNDNNNANSAAAAAAAAAVPPDEGEEEEGAANGGLFLLLDAIRRKQSSLATIQTGHPERASGGDRGTSRHRRRVERRVHLCRAIRPVEGGAAPYRSTAREQALKERTALWRRFAAARRSSKGVRSGGRLPPHEVLSGGCSSQVDGEGGLYPRCFWRLKATE